MSPLVYLDTSHIHLLTVARSKSDPDYSRFRDLWKSSGCELVLTRTHLLELRRYADSETRLARYALFDELAPVLTDSPLIAEEQPRPSLLAEREVLRAFVAKGMIGVSDEAAAKRVQDWCQIFPGKLSKPSETLLLLVMEDETFGWAAEMAYSALTTGAKARTRNAEQKYTSPRLGQIPEAVPGDLDLHKTMRQVDEALGDQSDTWRELGRLLPPDAIAALKYSSAAMMREMLRRQREEGPQSVIANLFASSQHVKALRTPLDELHYNWALRASADKLLRRVLDVADEDTREKAIAALSSTDCPGSWLRYATEIQLRKATPAPEPGDEYDLDHVAHAPYVDLLFADRRIVEFCRQAFARSDRPAMLNSVRPPVRAASVPEIHDRVAEVIK